MEICLQDRFPREKLTSLLDIKNKIRVGHSECCNCCCCKSPEFKAYKYIQPEIPKSFKPIRTYDKSDDPVEGCTTYKLSFWPNPPVATKPILPRGYLGIPDCPLSSDTTHKMSYLGNWAVKQQQKILPCMRNWFGRGPIDDKTTQKKDFTWKCGRKLDPIKYRGNLCLPRGAVEDNTTYKMSFYESNCHEPVKSFKPIRCYEKSGEPLEDYTTYRLSFFPQEPPNKETHPWQKKPQYHQPTTPLEGRTTYKLSYWPHCEERVKPIKHQAENNLLNRSCCFDDNTTYCLSYFGSCGDKSKPVLPRGHKIFDDCPITHDTVNKLSYFGNWCPKPEKPIIPCQRQLLGRGPIQDDTTQKCDFTWKCGGPESPIRPEGNLINPKTRVLVAREIRPERKKSARAISRLTKGRLRKWRACNTEFRSRALGEASEAAAPFAAASSRPRAQFFFFSRSFLLPGCTTNRLSYLPNCGECVLQNKSYRPVRVYMPSPEPMDLDTTTQLSYQPKEIGPIQKRKRPDYHKPTTSLDDNTTYGLSFIPPGKLIPCCPEEQCNVKDPCCPVSTSKPCSTSVYPQASAPDTRPCISC
ncbi:stabilizer of axonemal microtubules 1-like [Phymastichus coffea]|uniref:stabilizer of axonemal microtubules 1-like n=1 Tax=Phymastichus coffea TaxID=108790 RepID=UPI00273B1F6C|nr:stabilizer of axonemal microtubules 1-like [Phymastichus coffea]